MRGSGRNVFSPLSFIPWSFFSRPKTLGKGERGRKEKEGKKEAPPCSCDTLSKALARSGANRISGKEGEGEKKKKKKKEKRGNVKLGNNVRIFFHDLCRGANMGGKGKREKKKRKKEGEGKI